MKPVDFVHSVVTGPARRRAGMTVVAFALFVCAVLGVVALALWADRRLGIRLGMSDRVALATGLLVLGFGAALVSWCVLVFGAAGGTPVPFSPPRGVVMRGPYRRVRNPMLTGFFAALAGVGLALRSPALLFVVVPAVAAVAWLELRLIEEPELKRRFGAAYVEYRRCVPMFMPSVGRARRAAAGGGAR